jgi:protein gp37
VDNIQNADNGTGNNHGATTMTTTSKKSRKTGIEWTTETWNPTVGCSIKSAGCSNCFAMKFAHRLAQMRHSAEKYSGLTRVVNDNAVWNGVVRLDEPSLGQPLTTKKPTVYFVNSMSDLGHEALSDAQISRVWGVMRAANWHDYQVLTKRPDRLRQFLCSGAAQEMVHAEARKHRADATPLQERDPVWLGTSVENQAAADERIPELMRTPARIRFLSIEPLLGPTSIRSVIERELANGAGRIHWVIVGGESGPGARPMHPMWARRIRDECAELGIAFFFKQVGSWAWKSVDSRGRKATRALMPDGTVLQARTTWPAGAQPIIFGSKKSGGRLLDGKMHEERPFRDAA